YTGFKDGVNEISIDINGSKGSLRLDNTKGVFLGRDQKHQLLPGSFSRDWMNEGLVNQWKEFSEAILNGREPMASGNRTLKVMKVLFAAFESASSGKTIKLN
ncbi:MAG: hypothetical protein GYB55_17920, partial [Cytophagales bacterium]|nr:hypothetical protein [Cytophagales bacterium]